MKENQDKKLEKWESEIEVLEKVKDLLVKYSKLKDEKAEKDKVDRMNAKIASIIEDNYWTRLEWGTIKRGKQSREDGLKKIEKKIADREKKIAAHKAELEEAGGAAGRDWTAEIEACTEGSRYYHWAYGEMEVLAAEDQYIYLKVLDKKGVKHEWLGKNNAEVIDDEGEVVKVKEFPRNAIGAWLFPEKDDVTVQDPKTAHKMFK